MAIDWDPRYPSSLPLLEDIDETSDAIGLGHVEDQFLGRKRSSSPEWRNQPWKNGKKLETYDNDGIELFFFDSICMFMWDLAGIGDAVWFDSSEDFREKVVAYHLIQRVPANVVNGWLMGLLPYRRGKFSKWPWYPSKFAAIIYPRSEQSLSNVGWKPNIKASS